MQKLRQKRPRLELNIEDYNLLRRRVLERDGWRCQTCGSSKDLNVHHLTKRSKLGDDADENLITLCTSCHTQVHHSDYYSEHLISDTFTWRRIGRGVRKNSFSPPWASPV